MKSVWCTETDMLPRSLLERSWPPFCIKMIDLGTPFAPKCWILVSFSTDFGSFFATDFFRPPRLPRTRQLDRKLQEHASKFKNMQTASLNKDTSTKTPILNVQIAKRQQLQQTPIDKYGGGGARAARRIRIRRPRRAAEGLEACQILIGLSAVLPSLC